MKATILAALLVPAIAQAQSVGRYDREYVTVMGSGGGTFYGAVNWVDDINACWGTSSDACIQYDTAQTADAMCIGLSTDSETLHIAQKADCSVDWTLADQGTPTLVIHDADATDVTKYLLLQHDGSDAVVSVGTGNLTIDTAVEVDDAVAMAGDLTSYVAVNDGSPEIRFGATDAEELHIQSVYDAGAQTLDYVLFATDVASATADKGKYLFNVDGASVLAIDDDGIEVVGSAKSTTLLPGTQADPADSGVIRIDNAESICWEASPAGTDQCLVVDATEVLTYAGTIQGGTVTDGTLTCTSGTCTAGVSITSTTVVAGNMTMASSEIDTSGAALTLESTGTAGTAYVEIVDDNNAGYLALGQTGNTSGEGSLVSIVDGGQDNGQGKLCLYEDDGNGSYLWVNTASVLRGSNSNPSDDDADGYAIMDLSTGTIGASAQDINGEDITLSANASVAGQVHDSALNTETPAGTTETIDWDNGNIQKLDLEDATGDVTLTLSNPQVARYLLIIQQDGGGGARNVVWPGAVKWANASAPTISTGNDEVDVIECVYDGSASYYCGASQDFQ